MRISLKNIGKRFNSEWIFRGLNYELTSGNGYVILGANGSGKSTLIQSIAGYITLSEGSILYEIENKKEIATSSKHLTSETLYQYVSIAAPYLDLLEEYTLEEAIAFHFQFKKMMPGQTIEDLIKLTTLQKSKNKQLKYFSSGMKQRVKLVLAILSDVPLLLLDEPCSNLDKAGIEWYQQLVKNHSNNRLIIVCSNQQKEEYSFCNTEISFFTC